MCDMRCSTSWPSGRARRTSRPPDRLAPARPSSHSHRTTPSRAPVRRRCPGTTVLPSHRGCSRCSARHHDDPHDPVVAKRQTDGYLTLIRHLARRRQASDLMLSGEKVAVDLTELGLQVFHRELLIPTGLPKHLPTCCDASKGV